MSTARRVFRKNYLTVFATLGATTLWFAFAIVARAQPSGVYGGAVIFGLMVYGLWLVGWHSAIRIDDENMVIDNVFIRHRIPLSQVSDVDVGTGLFVKASDGFSVGSIMFGGSVIGNILGYRYTRAICAQINEEIARRYPDANMRKQSASGREKTIYIPYVALLLIIGMTEVIAAVSSLF
jgi:hypothetical protein